jgi:UDP-glucose 4-epimerase
MHHFITGVAGFIGSQLADYLLAKGERVCGVDDFPLGRPEHLHHACQNTAVEFFEYDISHSSQAINSLEQARQWGGLPDTIWHLAANSDIPAGAADASIDFRRTLQTTFAIIEAAKLLGVRQIAFASTSAIYGERSDLLIEDAGPLLPISNYGANKLGSEGLLSAAAEQTLDRVWIFRFPNVVGPRTTHGAILDFIKRLSTDSNRLTVLGDGMQTKPYLHVAELIEAMDFIVRQATDRRNVFNIGPNGPGTSVAFIAEHVVARVRPGTPIVYSGGNRGWVGDVPLFNYSNERLARLGWGPTLSSDQAVVRAIDELAAASPCPVAG